MCVCNVNVINDHCHFLCINIPVVCDAIRANTSQTLAYFRTQFLWVNPLIIHDEKKTTQNLSGAIYVLQSTQNGWKIT